MPAFTVGMASYIAILEGLRFVTGRSVYPRISRFWIRIFSVAFGVGVVMGVITPFQIGSKWSRFADAAGNVLGPLFAYERLTAFFLEPAFLGVLLFGRKLVPPCVHFMAALMVASGMLFSSFWILAANSWMQTPASYAIADGRFFPKDWFGLASSSSFRFRLADPVTGFYVTTAFVVLAIAAWADPQGTIRRRGTRHVFDDALDFLLPLQIFLGDQRNPNLAAHQPAKLAVIEARWDMCAAAGQTTPRNAQSQ